MERVRRLLRRLAAWDWRANAPKIAALAVGWAVVAIPVAYHDFMSDTREAVVAGHDAIVSPTSSNYATIDLGAYLPNVRYPTHGPFGVRIEVGKTNLDSYEGLIDRYALIASHPEGEISKVTGLVHDMLIADALRGAMIGLAVPGLWLLLGRRRRAEIWEALSASRVALAGVGAVVVLLAASSDPWSEPPEAMTVSEGTWRPIQSLLPDTPIAGAAAALEVQSGLITQGTRRLIESAIDTYNQSVVFYDDLAAEAPDLAPQLRQPDEDETVALLVSDRHDNVGMDRVARAIGDAGGATMLLDAGDDTSTGETWEAFSLDSLAQAFDGYDERYVVPGNHDNGDFVGNYLDERGFHVLLGSPHEAKDDIRLLGAPDPRSSGLGSWRTTNGLTLEQQGHQLADTACRSNERDERVSTLLVHDASIGAEALRRGCVDLVLGGHLHVQVGPDTVTGDNGEVGASYTNGTTGGAAYAFALGSKLRREAEVTLVTYRSGVPIGLQPVKITTPGRFRVGSFVGLPSAAGLAAR